MLKMKNKIELLKLDYDLEKTMIFAILAILVVISFGVTQTEGIVTLVTGGLIVICIFVEGILISRIKKTIKNLREQFGYDKNEKI